jgi:hypothetical protein
MLAQFKPAQRKCTSADAVRLTGPTTVTKKPMHAFLYAVGCAVNAPRCPCGFTNSAHWLCNPVPVLSKQSNACIPASHYQGGCEGLVHPV